MTDNQHAIDNAKLGSRASARWSRHAKTKHIPICYPDFRFVSTDNILLMATDAIVNGDAAPACEYDDDPIIGSALSLHDAGIITLIEGWRDF